MPGRVANRLSTIAPLAFVVLCAAPVAAQTTYTWTGAALDANWSSALNWSASGPGTSPPLDDLTNTFLVMSGAVQTSNVLDYSFSANSLLFDAAAGAFVVGTTATPQTLTLGSGGITVAAGNANDQTFNANLTLGADQIWANNGTGAFIVGGNVNNGGFLLTVGGAGNTSIGGQISGAGGLTKTGAGTLTLSGVNTFSGNVIVNGGTLSVAADTAFGAVPGAATAGKIVLDNGTLAISASFALSTNRGVAIGPSSGTGTGTIDVASGQTLTYAGVIANNGGTGGLTKTGLGTLTLSGTNTYGGATTINGGVLSINASGVLPTGTAKLTINGGVFRHTSTGAGSTFINTSHPIEIGALGGTIDIPSSAAILIYAPASSTTLITSVGGPGTGTITKTGAGTLRLSTSVTAGALMNIQKLVVLGGLWQAGVDGCFGALPGAALADQITLNGGGISSNAGFTLNANRGITLGASGGIINTPSNLTYSGKITGTGGLTKTGPNTLILGGASNDYTGGTTINQGTIQLTTGNNRLPATGNLTFSAASTLDLNTRSQSVNALSSTGAVGTITSSAAGTPTLTVGNGNGSGTFGGVIQNGSGTVALTKIGTGTQTLTGTNTYTGATSVTNGALIVNGSITASAISVTAAGTVGGTGTAGASLSLSGGGTLSPGSSPGTLTTGAASFGTGGNYNWQLLNAIGAAGTGYDVLNATTLDVAASSIDPFKINLWTLSSIGPDTNGPALNFDPSQTYSWTLVHTTGGITNFSADKFLVNEAATNGAGGFQNSTLGGLFSVGLSVNTLDLVLQFTPVPVPELGSGWLVAAAAVSLGMVRSVRRRRSAPAA